ncbi:NUDIX domain-containing protein [Acinetobacter sp. MD2]|uniref:NUDIX hydrolase n=1 Tax=Acinetobacter sp. MD2 TaxID=2600066 RepID=UPI002D1F6A86|nr:NUDIX domain-containing protein [Acinetobacter sp. MD2]MEB3768081.1 NUDIX domain-containing protein [Acinetobacter sp. MD2]
MQVITVAAALIMNEKEEVLLARKQGTQFFMQVGGKLEKNESADVCMLREIQEELGVAAEIIQDLGLVKTMAANEADTALHAYIFEVKLLQTPQACAELAEIMWVHPTQAQHLPLAPLTEHFIFPFLLNGKKW